MITTTGKTEFFLHILDITRCIIAVLAAVAASHSTCYPALRASSYCNSSFVCLRSLTVRFLGVVAIISNQAATSFIYFINSPVDGDWRNFTVFIKAFLNYAPRMYAASISKTLSPRAIRLVIAYSSISLRVSRNASTFHFQKLRGKSFSQRALADIIVTSFAISSFTFGKNL